MLGQGFQFSTNATRFLLPTGREAVEVGSADVVPTVVVEIVESVSSSVVLLVEVVEARWVVDVPVDPHCQSSADSHSQCFLTGSNMVPAGHRSRPSLPFQQWKNPRQSMLPGKSAGAANRPCCPAQNSIDQLVLVTTFVETVVDGILELVAAVVVGETGRLVVRSDVLIDVHCQANIEGH